MGIERWRLIRRLSGVVFFAAWVVQGVVVLRGGRISLVYLLANGVYLALSTYVERVERRPSITTTEVEA